MTKIVLLVVIVMMSIRYSCSATPDGRPCQHPDALNLDTDDIQNFRQLKRDNPSLTQIELTQQIPITALQLDLLQWMRDDLVKYIVNHEDIWEDRYRKRPELKEAPVVCSVGYSERPSGPNLDMARKSLEEFQVKLAQSDSLTLRDFYRLVPVFALPDETDEYRRFLDVTTETLGVLGRDWLPDCGLVFTIQTLGFRRLAQRFLQPVQYVCLISHSEPVKVHGWYMMPSEFLAHDLYQARDISFRKSSLSTEWLAVHGKYTETFP